MNKIICDVCGTAYPETASQCPICGSARPADAKGVAAEANETEQPRDSSYTYVKGGRFSKSNVRKRNKLNQTSGAQVEREVKREAAPAKQAAEPVKHPNRGLMITVVILLLAIIAVSVYIAVRFFLPNWLERRPQTTIPQTTAPQALTTSTTGPTAAPTFPCTDLVLSETVVELQEQNASHLLNIAVVPENTTDKLVFASNDPSVATVDGEGKVTAVGSGQTVITATCGNVVREIQIVCNFVVVPTGETTTPATTAPETTAPDETTQPPTEAVSIKLTLNRSDFTLAFRGDSWKVYDGDHADLITWTSDNENIATVENGVVTAVSAGQTEIHGEYNGQKVDCIVRCTFN